MSLLLALKLLYRPLKRNQEGVGGGDGGADLVICDVEQKLIDRRPGEGAVGGG